jgi:hypothetical protein
VSAFQVPGLSDDDAGDGDGEKGNCNHGEDIMLFIFVCDHAVSKTIEASMR